MSATTAGALKAYLETLGLGMAWYRDMAPATATLPYGTIDEGVDETPQLMGLDDPTVAEMVTVNTWEPRWNADGSTGETYDLPRKLVAALHGARLPTHPVTVDGMLVVGRRRLLEVDKPGKQDPADQANVVHNAITVMIYRSADAS